MTSLRPRLLTPYRKLKLRDVPDEKLAGFLYIFAVYRNSEAIYKRDHLHQILIKFDKIVQWVTRRIHATFRPNLTWRSSAISDG